MNYIGIIPARYASTRFPGKPLAMLGGKPVIQRVYEQVSGVMDDVLVATDDERILKTVEGFGGKAVMTRADHKSGTDRCYEAYVLQDKPYDVVVNIQGDEPFIQPQQLEAVKACFADPQTEIATLVKPFTLADGWPALENVNSPKVVVNHRMQALYFSRSIIPYQRNKDKTEWLKEHVYYKHIGLYAYKADVLKELPAAIAVGTGRIVGTITVVGKRLYHQGGHQRNRNHRHRHTGRPRSGRSFPEEQDQTITHSKYRQYGNGIETQTLRHSFVMACPARLRPRNPNRKLHF